MNSLLLLSLLVAAVSAGNIIYTPGYQGFGYGYAHHGLYPYAYAGHGFPYAYGAFPGYHPFGYPALVAAKPAEDAAEEEPAAEEGDRKKRSAPAPVEAHHVPGYAFPYAFPYAHPYAHPYAFPAVVKAEPAKVEVKKVVHTLPAYSYSALPYYGYPGFYHGLPYVKVVKEEEEAEEARRKKRQVLLGAPYALHHPFAYAHAVPAVKRIEVDHTFKTAHLEPNNSADTPADTTLVELKEKEHVVKHAYNVPLFYH